MAVHKLTIRNKPGTEGQPTRGMNTDIFLDGKPLRGASFIKFEVGAKKMAKVMIELYAEVEVDATVILGDPAPVDANPTHFVKFRRTS